MQWESENSGILILFFFFQVLNDAVDFYILQTWIANTKILDERNSVFAKNDLILFNLMV